MLPLCLNLGMVLIFGEKNRFILCGERFLRRLGALPVGEDAENGRPSAGHYRTERTAVKHTVLYLGDAAHAAVGNVLKHVVHTPCKLA